MRTPIKSALALPTAIAVVLLLTACGGRHSTATPAQSSATRAAEYRAGLNAYLAGRIPNAFEHFRAAAELGNTHAQYYTGLMYANGEGTKQNYHEAAQWYQKAAAHNQPDALVQLARLYVTGLGVDIDVAKATELFGRAARVYPPGAARDQALQQKKVFAAIANP